LGHDAMINCDRLYRWL